MICRASGFKKVDSFGKYLRSFIDGAPRNRQIYDKIMEALQNKLAGWKAKLLSQASRVVLIKLVLSSLPVYHLSYFALTDKEVRKCDSIVANFFWGNHQNSKTPHMIAWNKICQPKTQGGLGIRRFKDFNSALLGRQAWRIIHNPNAILSKVYRAKYCCDPINLTFQAKSQATPLARKICKQIDIVTQNCKWKVGNGQSIHIGSRLWYQPLGEHNGLNTVADLFNQNGSWDFQKVSALFDDQTTRLIMHTPISHTNLPD